MEFDVLSQSVMSAMDSYRRDAGLEPKPEYLAIHVHPEDHAEIVASAPKWLNVEYLLQRAALGIKLVLDTEVAIGHPEIRSTWKWVL